MPGLAVKRGCCAATDAGQNKLRAVPALQPQNCRLSGVTARWLDQLTDQTQRTNFNFFESVQLWRNRGSSAFESSTDVAIIAVLERAKRHNLVIELCRDPQPDGRIDRRVLSWTDIR